VIKQISTQDIEVGMYITDANNQWIPDKNPSQYGLIKKQSTVDKIRQLNIDTLYIDTQKGVDSPAATAIAAPTPPPVTRSPASKPPASAVSHKPFPGPTTSLDKERIRAGNIAAEAKNMVNNAIGDVQKGKAIDVNAVGEIAEDMIESITCNQNALACLSRIRHKDEYLLEHSVNVGVLMGIFSRSLGSKKTLQKELITGALLHDIGKTLVPDTVLNKPGKLDEHEWLEMQRHVTYGEQILDATEGLSDTSRLICAQHHERLDGSGYPRQLKGDAISPYGRMAAVVDVYDAITANRVYHQGMPPTEALKKLVQWSVSHLDKQLVYAFIRCVSIYPVGTLVQLNNQRAGVIIQANQETPDRPVVRVFYDTQKTRQITPVVLDLKFSIHRKTHIIATLDTNIFAIDVRPFL